MFNENKLMEVIEQLQHSKLSHDDIHYRRDDNSKMQWIFDIENYRFVLCETCIAPKSLEDSALWC